MPKIKFDHCVIHVSEWDRSNAFYRDVIGAEVMSDGKPLGISLRRYATQPAWTWLDADACAHGCRCSRETAICVLNGPGVIDGAVAHLNKCNVPIELGADQQRWRERARAPASCFRDQMARCWNLFRTKKAISRSRRVGRAGLRRDGRARR